MPSNMSPEIMEAMKRRQMGAPPTPALNQMTPQAAGAPQMPPPTPVSQMTQASAPQGAPAGTPPTAPKFQPQDRTDLITLALIEQMKNDNKLVKEESKMAEQPAPAPMPAPTPSMPPMGGGGFSMSPGYEQPMPVNQMQGDYQNGMGKDYSGLNNYGKGMGGGQRMC